MEGSAIECSASTVSIECQRRVPPKASPFDGQAKTPQIPSTLRHLHSWLNGIFSRVARFSYFSDAFILGDIPSKFHASITTKIDSSEVQPISRVRRGMNRYAIVVACLNLTSVRFSCRRKHCQAQRRVASSSYSRCSQLRAIYNGRSLFHASVLHRHRRRSHFKCRGFFNSSRHIG